MKDNQTLPRERIVRTLADALEPLDYVHALWEGGAVAFGRVDEWSDIDICIDAEDERVKEAFPVAERALESLSPIELKYEVPVPPLHGYVQAFYRLKGTSEFMLVDFAVFKHSSQDKLLEPEIHGMSRFHFNKANALKCPPLDQQKFMASLEARLDAIQIRLDVFKCFVPKQINRGNYIDALAFYHRFVLDPLVELLRMKYKPVRHSFKTYYVHYDLPAGVVKRLKGLYFVKDERELQEKCDLAEQWFHETVRQMDFGEIEQRLRNAR